MSEAEIKYTEPGEVVIEIYFDVWKSGGGSAKWFYANQHRDVKHRLGELESRVQHVITALLRPATMVTKVCARQRSLRIIHSRKTNQGWIMAYIEDAFRDAGINFDF